MKCPYRTIESYTKLEKFREPRQEGGFNYLQSLVPCTKSEAHTVKLEYADCLLDDCPAFKNNKCLKLED